MDDDESTEQFVFDFRTPLQKKLQQSQKTENEFRKEFKIWEDQPKIIDSYELQQHRGNNNENLSQFSNSTVHLLEEQSLIMIVKSMRKQVIFDFFESHKPYNRLRECIDDECQELDCDHELLVWDVKCEQQTRTTIVRNTKAKGTRNPNRLLAVIDDQNISQKISKTEPNSTKRGNIKQFDTTKVVEMVYDEELRIYSLPEVKIVLQSNDSTTAAYLMEKDRLLILTESHAYVYDANEKKNDWKELSRCLYQQVIDLSFTGQHQVICAC